MTGKDSGSLRNTCPAFVMSPVVHGHGLGELCCLFVVLVFFAEERCSDTGNVGGVSMRGLMQALPLSDETCPWG
jgi:hypothetical protein